MRNGCLVQGCALPPSSTGWCRKHAAPADVLAAMRRAADPIGATMSAQAATDRRTRGVLAVRPTAVLVACPGCGRQHALPVGALDRPVRMGCGAWLKPALTVGGAA